MVSAQNRNRYYWTNFEVTQPEDKGILLKDIIENLTFNEIMPKNVEFKENYAQWDINNRGNKSQDQRAYYANGKHGTLPANGGGSKVKVCGGAIRGRYLVDGKRQDQKIKTAGLTEQRLEVRKDEKTNTLTTVQKDNVVVFRPCELRENSKPVDSGLWHVANAVDIKGMDCIKRVYHQNGKAPTLTTMGGGHREPKVLCNDNYYRKLTPLECERLQTFPDNWTSCVSNTQRYKALGNAWTVDVIAHILTFAFPK